MKKFEGNAATPLRTHVHTELQNAILDGSFPPGSSLNELKLSAELGVSRTPVREALMQLELQGLVKTVPNRGAVVVGVSEQDIEDIYLIRTRIEGLIACRAAERITAEQLDELSGLVELQEFYVAKNEPMQVLHLDSRFHELLYECCGSRPLMQTMKHFLAYIQTARQNSVKRGRAPHIAAEHRVIIDAIRRGDAEAAERAMIVHVSNARDSFFASL